MYSCPLICQPDPENFASALLRLEQRFKTYTATTVQPLPASGLLITPEIRYQSELYLPIKEIRGLFYRLYQAVLPYQPIFSSSPFHISPSWADCFAGLPCWLQFSANPARLLERLLEDQQLLTRFLFFSFLPGRFNGTGFGRYPDQLTWLRAWLANRGEVNPRILDAACGSGEGAWELLELVAESGGLQQSQIEGWTIEPLEVWAAQNQLLPHEPKRERIYQHRVQPLLEQGCGERISFRAVDLLEGSINSERFDLILCNGLLGGPIIHQPYQLQQVITVLGRQLLSGGVLVVADRFHAGWKKQVPQNIIVGLLHDAGLEVEQAGEGLAGVKPYT